MFDELVPTFTAIGLSPVECGVDASLQTSVIFSALSLKITDTSSSAVTTMQFNSTGLNAWTAKYGIATDSNVLISDGTTTYGMYGLAGTTTIPHTVSSYLSPASCLLCLLFVVERPWPPSYWLMYSIS